MRWGFVAVVLRWHGLSWVCVVGKVPCVRCGAFCAAFGVDPVVGYGIESFVRCGAFWAASRWPGGDQAGSGFCFSLWSPCLGRHWQIGVGWASRSPLLLSPPRGGRERRPPGRRRLPVGIGLFGSSLSVLCSPRSGGRKQRPEGRCRLPGEVGLCGLRVGGSRAHARAFSFLFSLF